MRRAVTRPIMKAPRLAALAATALLLPAAPVEAQTTVDYDTDDDGLIEVGSLAQLDAIRYDMDGDGAPRSAYQGTTRYAAAFPNASTAAATRMGCPGGACTGYELTTDLDFDTNDDGDIDEDDDYWNNGAGWLPLSNFPSGNVFTATFEGNGHVAAEGGAGAEVTVIAGSPTSATVTLADAGGPGFESGLEAGLPVRAVHLVELRLRVDALRRAHGLAAFAWTDAVVEPGVTPVRAVHPTELRTALDEVYDAAGRARPRYADASIRAGATAIRAAHFLELRSAVVALENPGG